MCSILLILIIGVICIYFYQTEKDTDKPEPDKPEPDKPEPDKSDTDQPEPDNTQLIPFYGIKNTSISSGKINNDGWVSENSYNDNGDFTQTDPKYTITIGDKIYNGEWIQFELKCINQTKYMIKTDNIEFVPCNIIILVSNDGKEWVKYKEENKCVDMQEQVVFTGDDIIAAYCKIIILNIKPRNNNNETRPVKINYIDISECSASGYFECNHKTKLCDSTKLKTNFKNKNTCKNACYLWNCNYDTGVCTEFSDNSRRDIFSTGDAPENIECKNFCQQTKFVEVSPTQLAKCYYLMSCGIMSDKFICLPGHTVTSSPEDCGNGKHVSKFFPRDKRVSNADFSTTDGKYIGSEHINLTNGQTLYGEWIGMSAPLSIVVVRYKLECDSNVFNSWVLVANNDEEFNINSEWNILDSRSNVSLYNMDGIAEIGMYKQNNMFTIDIENTTEYKNYLIVITTLKSGYSSFNITYFNLYTL